MSVDITKSLDKGVEYSSTPMDKQNEHKEITKSIIELLQNRSMKEAMWILETTMYDLFRHSYVESPKKNSLGQQSGLIDEQAHQ